jgi:predicted transcriptional regulator
MRAKLFRFRDDGSGSVLGPLEAVIMDIIWTAQATMTVGDLEAALRTRGENLAYSTVKTVMTNLVEKGLLTKRAAGRANEFTATQTRTAFERTAIGGVVDSLLREYRNPLLSHLADELVTNKASLAEFEHLLAERRQNRRESA